MKEQDIVFSFPAVIHPGHGQSEAETTVLKNPGIVSVLDPNKHVGCDLEFAFPWLSYPESLSVYLEFYFTRRPFTLKNDFLHSTPNT
jgi:hypothetical protein